jgi:hypothetical protein
MIVTYFRSSSYNAHDFCNQRYFLEYNLGLKQPSGKRAEIGTIVHKVLELIARARQCEQYGENKFVDDALGTIVFASSAIIYKDSFVNRLLNDSYNFYVNRSLHDYSIRDQLECRNLVYEALEFGNGLYDPRKRNIVAPEISFDMELKEDWAAYEYELPDGEVLKGNLAVKGTIDLVTEEMPAVYESTDWKTGKRIDWATGKEKDFDKLCVDPQLRIYHMALSMLFPEVKQFIPTIYYIADGGPFTMSYGPEDIVKTKEMLRKKFEHIKRTTRPHLNKSWRCSRICHFGKQPHPSGDIDPRTGEPYTICAYIDNKLRKKGMDTVLLEDKAEGHHFDYYQNPGE